MSQFAKEKTTDLKVVSDQRTQSLPSWIYHNPEFFELEREEIFMRSWQFACHVSNIPNVGDFQTFSLLGEMAFVVRGKDNQLRAFHNVCRHRAARLLDGMAGNCGNRITCPYHAWTYSTDGELVGVPYKAEFENFEQSAHNLVPIELEIFRGFVFVRFEPGGPSITDMLKPVKQELDLYPFEDMKPMAPVVANTKNVNWKNGTDNYIDALHVKAAHPGLGSLIGRTYEWGDIGGIHRLTGFVDDMPGASWSVKAYRALLPEVDYLPDDYKRRWLYFKVWPNFAFNLYPDCTEIMQFEPTSPTTMQIRYGTYGLPDTRREMKAARFVNERLNLQVNVEDTEIIERVQAGMTSRSYRYGPLAQVERCLQGFAQRMRQELPVSRLPEPPAPGQVAQQNADLQHS